MPRSKFGDIYRDLKYKIESGEYPYQSLVPSENTLVAVYGCSRNTVRRALAGLIEAGYVQAIQGKGVRVLYRPAARTPFTLGRMESFCETARRCRTDYQTKVVHFSMTQTDGALAAASGFPPGADVYHVERVRIIDGRAMVLEVSYFLRSVVTTLTPEAAEQSIYAYLERELDIQIMTSKRTITVEHASPADRLYLDMGSYDCLAVVSNQAFNADGILFEYTVSHYHPEYFQPPRQESGAVNRPKILSCTKEPLRPKQPGSFSFSAQGGPISARIRATETYLVAVAQICIAGRSPLANLDSCPCSTSAVSSAGRASAAQSLLDKIFRRTAHSAVPRTLSPENFPACVPAGRTCRPAGIAFLGAVRYTE